VLAGWPERTTGAATTDRDHVIGGRGEAGAARQTEGAGQSQERGALDAVRGVVAPASRRQAVVVAGTARSPLATGHRAVVEWSPGHSGGPHRGGRGGRGDGHRVSHRGTWARWLARGRPSRGNARFW